MRKPVLEIIRRGDECLALGQAMQFRGEHQIDNDDRRHEVHTHQPSVADAKRLAGEREQRVATILRRVKRKHEHHETNPRTGEVKIFERILFVER